MSEDHLFEFVDEHVELSSEQHATPWTVLSVEDDPGYQQSLLNGLAALKVKDRPVECITANSATSAAAILAERSDIAVILLDVVMERDDAGLFLINTIRNVLGNNEVRIILLTGQPGMAPRLDTMRDFDVDEYWNKVDLTEDKLRTIVASNIRTWQSMTELNSARRGLQMIVEASKAITSRHNIDGFTKTVLAEISRIIGVPDSGGVACAYRNAQQLPEDSTIVAATGDFARHQQRSVKDLLEHYPSEKSAIHSLFSEAVTANEHKFDGSWSALYFTTQDVNDNHYLFLVKSPQKLLSSHISLLMVFSENVSNGFMNIALMDKLSSLAFFDSDLNVANRNWLQRQFQNSSTFDRNETIMVLVKVDDFYTCEILLGADYALGMLRQALEQLRQRLSPHFAVARLEDDTFAFLMHRSNLPDTVQLEHATELSLELEGITHKSECFIAVLDVADLDDEEPDRAIRLAEATLHAGHHAGSALQYYSPTLREELSARYLLLKELHCALNEKSGLKLKYQPKHDLRTGKIVGAEALLRWQHPFRGDLSPAIFIPVAETSGLVNKIDLFVMQQVFKDIKTLVASDIGIPVSFNVSSRDFDTPLFMEAFKVLLSEKTIDPGLLEIEITETQAMENYTIVMDVLKVIADSGVKVSIDDFGTGYSSLAHISKLSAHTLKVDQTFVKQLTGDEPENALAVIRMIKKLSDEFNTDIIAEGVENEQQRDVLLENGYHCAQGYLFSEPMPLTELISNLQNQRHH
ncbi:EAL domain-containing protein [Salinimonas iocasae]|uniref:EAL domain-containing protein n=1 Tax=Salinimonas iocasae TaxID=2572577 RepID=A0A5B7YBG6_9ALTE|nr:EAL domain-containing protein [Salinimonas iocasae]QCZ92546.1 EAL domain-containing protein [Salinimonas iocasae]